MAIIIKPKRSTTPGNVPTLNAGELGINIADKKIYMGDGASAVLIVNGAAAAGSASIYETEIDFGTTNAVYNKTFTITDASVTSTSKIIVYQSGSAATGRQADENELETLNFAAIPGTGSFTLYAKCMNRVSGKYKINYMLG
jgi:hypothetical protein